MKLRTTLLTSALGAFVALASCSEDSSKKVPPGMGEAGEAGEPSVAGKGGSGGTGGTAAEGGKENGGAAGIAIGPDLMGGAAGAETGATAGTGGTVGGGPAPALLFTVDANAEGITPNPVASSTRRASTVFGSISASPSAIMGTNDVRITGAELGLAEGDAILSFAVLQPEPAHPLYWFSVGPNEGGEGEAPTRLSFSSAASEALGDVYFSDATQSYRSLGEGSDVVGYNGLVADQSSLGLSPNAAHTTPTHEDNLTGVGALPSGLTPRELYFTVAPASSGVAGSAVAATDAGERGCTVFHSDLGGSNTVAYHCADLGLASGSQLTGLVLYGTTKPTQALFALASGSTGLELTAAASTPNLTSSVFSSPLDGTNSLKVDGKSLGVLGADSLDALAVVDQAPEAYSFADRCALNPSPYDANGGNVTSVDSGRDVGRDLLLVQGPSAGTVTGNDNIAAYKLSTCALVDKSTLPSGLLTGATWAPVPGDNWAETTPFAALEYWVLSPDASSVSRYDHTGTRLGTFPLDGISATSANAVALNYDPVDDWFYGVIGQSLPNGALERISFPHPSSARPDGTRLTTTITRLPQPCAFNPSFSGVDDAGNSVYGQYDSAGRYRVCTFSHGGEFASIPFTWVQQNATDFGVLAPTHALYAILRGEGVVVERYAPQ